MRTVRPLELGKPIAVFSGSASGGLYGKGGGMSASGDKCPRLGES